MTLHTDNFAVKEQQVIGYKMIFGNLLVIV